MDTVFSNHIRRHSEAIAGLAELQSAIEETGVVLASCVKRRNKVLLCGNGGSAADAQHIAAELVGRFVVERKGLPAIALTTDTSIITAVSNDYGYVGNNIFNRHSFKLKKFHINNPPEMWIRKVAAFEGIVPIETFFTAQQPF